MASPKLTFALIQTDLFWEDKSKNLDHLGKKIDSINFDCDVIVLPEMFSTAFTMKAEILAEGMDGETVTWMKSMAAQSGKCVIGSLIAEEAGNHYNRLIWMNANGSYFTYDKRHLFRMADEDNFYHAGNKNILIELNGWKIRPLICYDLRFPVWSRNSYSIEDKNAIPEYDVLIYVANWPQARSLPWDALLRARAIENQAYCIGVNRIGVDGNDIPYNGHTAAIDPKGQYLLEPVENEEGVFKVSLDYNELISFREKFPQGLDADRFTLEL